MEGSKLQAIGMRLETAHPSFENKKKLSTNTPRTSVVFYALSTITELTQLNNFALIHPT